jgi:hypothetical protein
MQKYAVTYKGPDGDNLKKFSSPENALQYAGELKMNGAGDIELFESMGTVALEPKIVPVAANGNGAKKPARKAAKAPAKKAKKAKAPVKKAKAKGRPKQCIKPSCRKKNKGPRFSFLCVDHIGTAKATIEKWKAGKE